MPGRRTSSTTRSGVGGRPTQRPPRPMPPGSPRGRSRSATARAPSKCSLRRRRSIRGSWHLALTVPGHGSGSMRRGAMFGADRRSFDRDCRRQKHLETGRPRSRYADRAAVRLRQFFVATARPRPIPSGLPVANGSNSRSSDCGRRARAAVQTRNVSRRLPLRANSMRTQPPCPAASMPLSTRFNSNWRSWSASADNRAGGHAPLRIANRRRGGRRPAPPAPRRPP